MGKTNAYTAEQFIKAIPGTGGIVSTIAKRVGCEWNTAKRYIDDYPSIRKAYDNEREAILDLAETELYKAVQAGNLWAVKYVLSTIGKQRGFVERQEMTGADGGPVEVQWIEVQLPPESD